MTSTGNPDNVAAQSTNIGPDGNASQTQSQPLSLGNSQQNADPVNQSISPQQSAPDDAVQLIMQFLQEYGSYTSVAQALVFLEGYTERLFIDGLTNLRDVFDHLIRSARPGLDIAVVKHHLSEAREHLRRAGMNPLQVAVDREFQQIDRRLRIYYIIQAIFPDVAPLREIRKNYRVATNKLGEARALKSDITQLEKALEKLRECLSDLIDLHESMKPSGRSWAIRTGLAGFWAIVFILVGIAIKAWLLS